MTCTVHMVNHKVQYPSDRTCNVLADALMDHGHETCMGLDSLYKAKMEYVVALTRLPRLIKVSVPMN